LFELIEDVGKPDEGEVSAIDCGENLVRLWWD
jgi:hypothetical protein